MRGPAFEGNESLSEDRDEGDLASEARRRLRLAVDAFHLNAFAVIDGGHFDDLPTAFKRERLFARSLFLDKGDREVQTFGPWLVKLDQEPEATNKVFAIVGDKPAAVFWSCDAGEAVLHRHLRTINMVRIPAWAASGKDAPPPASTREHFTPVLFRHFDPSVLGALLPCLDATQFARFLGPAEQIAFVAVDFGGLKKVVANKSVSSTQDGMLTISSAQVNAMTGRRLIASHHRIMAYLREAAPAHTRGTSDDDLLYQIQYSESVGRSLGIRSERAHAQWAFLMVTSEGHVANEMTVTRFICAPGCVPDNQVDAALRQAMGAARDREGVA